MDIVSYFVPWLQVFFLEMTEPTGRAMVSLVSGWLFSPGRSLADRIRAAVDDRHRASCYYVLSAANWSIAAVGWRLLGAAQNRTRQAVRRSAATGFMLYSLVVLWYEAQSTIPTIRSYRGKHHASFADMLAALRQQSFKEYRQKHLNSSQLSPEIVKTLDYLETLLTLAA